MMRKVFLSTVAISVLAAGAASAASITYTTGSSPSTSGYTGVETSFGLGGTGQFSFPTFDPNLGTLTGISIELAVSGDFSTTVTETAGESGGELNELIGRLNMNIVDEGGNSVAMPTLQAELLGLFDPVETFEANDSKSFGPESVSDTFLFSPGNLATYIGEGGFVTWDSQGITSQLTDSSGLVAEFDTDAIVDLDPSITYTYSEVTEQVPVPAALPLLASALGVFGIARYRRRK